MLTERERNLLERGTTALRAGDYTAAERFCNEVLERAPGDAQALNVLGAIAFSRRNYREAERLFSLSASSSPDNTGALFNLGKVYEVQHRLDDAAATYSKILHLQPNNLQTRLRLGIVRYQQGALDEAIGAFERILKEDPEDETAALSLGVAYNAVARYEDSVRVLRGLLARNPHQVEAHDGLADSLYELHRFDEAAQTCRAALAIDPDDIRAIVLLGQVECDRGEYAAAEQRFRTAAAKEPERYEPPMNLGVLFQRVGRIEEGLEQGKRAVDLAPTEPLTHLNYAMGLLLAGRFEQGWREFEWRMADPHMRDHFPYAKQHPLWTGERFDGKLLVAREQGLGDFILFSRLFEQAKSRVSELIVEVPSELIALYRAIEGIEWCEDRIDSKVLGGIRAHVPLCSLPFVLGIRAHDIPARVPYLQAPKERVAAFRNRLATLSGKKIGIVWAGSPGHLLDRYRSAPARAFGELSDLDGASWVSLQKGAHEPMTALDALDLGPELHDFTDTAAAIEALDLVVSVDTAVAHLAGALAKPVWLLNGFGSFWLWQLRRGDSPWYPTMRLFRQPSPNDWNGLFKELRRALEQQIRE